MALLLSFYIKSIPPTIRSRKLFLMVPHNMAAQDIDRLSSFQINVEVSIKKRNRDSMDICNVPVKIEYFMMSNTKHVVSQQVDLLFTNNRIV